MANVIIIASLLSLICIIIIGFSIYWFTINIFFLTYKLEKYPKIETFIKENLYSICKEEGISVFYKSENEINAEKTKAEDRAVGQYIYTYDKKYQEKLDDTLIGINALESQYHDSFDNLCKRMGLKDYYKKEEYILPKILLANELITKYGLLSYYSTFIHEIGHHFASKKMNDHDEGDANREGWNLIKTRFPKHIQAIFYYEFLFRLKKPKSICVEQLKLFWAYFIYSINKAQ
jgi:hypothetical protein